MSRAVKTTFPQRTLSIHWNVLILSDTNTNIYQLERLKVDVNKRLKQHVGRKNYALKVYWARTNTQRAIDCGQVIPYSNDENIVIPNDYPNLIQQCLSHTAAEITRVSEL